MTTKVHLAADSRCRPLCFVLTPGQAGDAPAFDHVMAAIRIPRRVGRPRTRPFAVLADKAYSSRAIRDHLRRRGVRAVIPQPADQIANRKRKGRGDGRPTSNATPSNAASTASSNGAVSPPATRRPPRSTAPVSSSRAFSSGPGPPDEEQAAHGRRHSPCGSKQTRPCSRASAAAYSDTSSALP
ncbi:transposase [Streptomyces tanashiensis]